MKCDGFRLDLALFHIDFVTTEDNWDIFAYADEVTFQALEPDHCAILRDTALTVPVWNVLVGNTRCDVEHDDPALAVDVVAISQPTKLLLTCGIPDIENDVPQILLTPVTFMHSSCPLARMGSIPC